MLSSYEKIFIKCLNQDSYSQQLIYDPVVLLIQ